MAAAAALNFVGVMAVLEVVGVAPPPAGLMLNNSRFPKRKRRGGGTGGEASRWGVS